MTYQSNIFLNSDLMKAILHGGMHNASDRNEIRMGSHLRFLPFLTVIAILAQLASH